ncbi:hypothetical protein [Prosthecomicrobium sp. N25]|uniref:hypothetical protein n=1 Tax=Prosthecomicrobium sp. N25 TaxID=3129254 RepID=UPI0030789B78
MQRLRHLGPMLLGLLSGTACWLSLDYRPDLLFFSSFIPGAGRVSALPGVVFGLAVALALRFSGLASVRRLPLAILLVVLGWGLGFHAAMITGIPLEALIAGPDSRPGDAGPRLALAVALSIGSLVGGALTLFAFATATEARLSRARWATGLALGVLVSVMVGTGVGLEEETRFWISLFVLWQSTMIVAGLSSVAEAREKTAAPAAG